MIESGRAQLVLEDALLSVDARGPRATAGAGATAEIAPILSALAQFRFDSLKIRRGTLVLNAGAGAREVLGEISADLARSAARRCRRSAASTCAGRSCPSTPSSTSP